MKKILSLMLTVAMILTIITIPTSVAAATGDATSFEGDYVPGDKVISIFEASNADDLAGAYVLDAADGSKGEVLTATFDGETYAYASGGAKWLEIPMCPGFNGNGFLYIKFRSHAITDTASGDKSAYFYFANTHRLTKSLDKGLYQAADSSLTLTTAGPGMDNIYAISSTGAWTLYARQVGSDGPWIEITSGETKAHTNNKTFKVQSGLGINKVVVYTQQDAEPELEANYEEGDNLISSFEASNASDLAQLSSSSGEVVTKRYAGETFAYTTRGTDNNACLRVPQILPVLSDNKPVYVKLRVHAAFDATNGKTIYVWTKNSGNNRAGLNLVDGSLTNKVNNLTDSDRGVDVILEMKADGFNVYTKPVGTGEWSLDIENKTYDNRTGDNRLYLYYGLAITSAKVYTKVAPEIKAVNAAKDATAMETALATYATELGIDLSKLDAVNDDNAVYTAMIGSYETVEEIAAAFNAAVKAQKNAEFDGDYVPGDRIYGAFDASNAENLTASYVLNDGTVETFTVDGDTYAYANGGANWLEIPICPGLVEEGLYIKFRSHATDDSGSNKHVYVYFANTHRINQNLPNSLYQAADPNLTLTSAGPGMDNIYAVSGTGAWTLYARQVGSDGPWTEISSGQTAAHTNNKTLKVNCGVGISNVKVYSKQAPEFAAVNTAKDAAAMESVLTTYAETFGIDFTQLDKVENDTAVYAAMVGNVYTSAEDVVNAFNAAISAQVNAEFDSDYVAGDKILASFNANNADDLAQLYSTNGEVLTKVLGNETFAYTSKVDTGSALKVPQIVPVISNKEPVYVKMRVRAAFDNNTGKTIYIYTRNSGNSRVGFNMLSSVSNKTDVCADAAPAVDVIIKMTSDGYYYLYSKTVGSDVWALDGVKVEYQRNPAQDVLNIYYGLAVSDVKIYTKLPENEAAVVLTEDSVTVRNYESGNIVLASYESENGRMIDSTVITSGITADTAITFSDKLDTTDATVVKAFLLNDMSTFVPVCESKSVGLN